MLGIHSSSRGYCIFLAFSYVLFHSFMIQLSVLSLLVLETNRVSWNHEKNLKKKPWECLAMKSGWYLHFAHLEDGQWHQCNDKAVPHWSGSDAKIVVASGDVTALTGQQNIDCWDDAERSLCRSSVDICHTVQLIHTLYWCNIWSISQLVKYIWVESAL